MAFRVRWKGGTPSMSNQHGLFCAYDWALRSDGRDLKVRKEGASPKSWALRRASACRSSSRFTLLRAGNVAARFGDADRRSGRKRATTMRKPQRHDEERSCSKKERRKLSSTGRARISTEDGGARRPPVRTLIKRPTPKWSRVNGRGFRVAHGRIICTGETYRPSEDTSPGALVGGPSGPSTQPKHHQRAIDFLRATRLMKGFEALIAPPCAEHFGGATALPAPRRRAKER